MPWLKSAEDQIVVVSGVRYKFRKGELVGTTEGVVELLIKAGFKGKVYDKLPKEKSTKTEEKE